MRNVFKYTGFIFAGILILLYLVFLIVPAFINLDSYKSDIQKLVKENSKLNLDYSSLKLYSTPMLSIGVEIKDINVFYDDKTSLLKTSRLKGGIALPSLLTLTAKTSRIYIDNPNINLEIVNSSQYKIVSLIETILNEKIKEQNIEIEKAPMDERLKTVLKKVRIKVPYIKIANYLIDIKDSKTNHNLDFSGEELILKYTSARNKAKIKTIAKLKSDNKENINLDVNLTLPTPKIALVNDKPKEKNDPDEEIKIPFVNIVDIYQTYDLKANIKSKLKIMHSKNNGYIGFGYLNIDNLTLKLSHVNLPESYMHAKFYSNKIDYDTNIYTAKDEKLTLFGKAIYGKKNAMALNIQTDGIKFANLLELLKGLLDSLNIKNDIASIKATGTLSADTSIKTNFKKLTSQGYIKIKDGSFIHSKIGLGIKDIKADLNFDNNALNIQNTQALINNSLLKISGYINSKSDTEVNLNVKDLNIPLIYQAFAPKELKNAYNITNASLSLDTVINGKLNDLKGKINAKLTNLSLNDSKKTMFLTNSNALFNLRADKENLSAQFEDSNFIFNIPSANLKTEISKILVDINKDDIIIKPFDITYNTLSKINVKGEIKNCIKKPELDIFLSGFISTLNINQTLGKEIAYYIPSKGNIPLKISIKGNSKEQNILAQIFAAKNNYISPVNFALIKDNPSIMQADIKIKGNKIKLQNSGLYKKADNQFSDNLESNMQNSKELAQLNAVIEGNHLNLFRLNIPHELTGNIAIFKKSSFKTKGKLLINGNFDDLNFKGDLKAYEINIPELLTSIKDVNLNFASKTLKLIAKEINLNGSKIDAHLNADLKPSSVFKISNLEANSNLINVDKTLLILNELNKYLPPSSGNKSSKNTQASQNIPLSTEGKFNIKKITTGKMEIFNSKGNLKIKNNNLIIDKLTCNAFNGAINGDIGVNLISQLISIKMQGEKIDANEMFEKAANMKDTISGTLAFKTDISLKGATYLEQMKSLKGDLYFKILDGQYGPFAKLENFFLAENIRENVVFKNTIGAIISPITTIDSTQFEKLEGKLNFKNGVAYLSSITSQGEILCILINGNMNLLSNNLDSSVRVRLASAVSDMLGPLAIANPVNLVKNTPGLNIGTAKLFSFFTQVVTEDDYKSIPDFSSKHSDNNATKFQVILKGDVAKPLKLVKSFKWLALQADVDAAKEFSDKYIKEQEDLAKQQLIEKLQEKYEADNKIKVGVEKVLKMDTTAPEVKEMVLNDVLEKAKEKASTSSKLQTFQNKLQNVSDIIEAAKETQKQSEDVQQ